MFIERKKPSEIISWILVIVFFPGIGFMLYLLLGETTSMKMASQFAKKMRFDRLIREVRGNRSDGGDGENREQVEGALRKDWDMILMNERMDGSLLTLDNDIEIFTDAKEKYEALYRDIEAAKTSIHLVYFIFSADKVGKRFIDLLAKKAQEGVEVRLLYDTIGSLFTRFGSFRPIIAAGGSVSRFFPLINVLKLNYRNHRKIAVIDGAIAYTGGINIGKAYIGEHRRARPWRDTHLRITGSGVSAFQERFFMDWIYTAHESFDFSAPQVLDRYFPKTQTGAGSIAMQVVSSGPDVEGENIKYGYMKMITRAKKTLYMQSPYFIPDDSFMASLKIAVDSGVDVRIILPGIPDKPVIYKITTYYIGELLRAGVKVYLYNGFIHAKMFVIDGSVTSIGTTNIDIRSFLLDFEINAFIYDQAFSERCEQIFRTDMENSREIFFDEHNRRSIFKKLLETVLRILSPLI